MTIRILCVGKIKEAFYRDAIAELMKRMGRYAAAEVIEVAEEKAPEGLSQAEKEQILANEGERLLGKTDERDHIIALCIEGKKLTSEAFAAHINAAMLAGKSRIVFIIGGSFGLHPSVKALSSLRLSMSPMTFPHHLARVMLLEQIYRAYQINAGSRYHK